MATFRMFGGTIHSALVHAATRYDERQSKGKRYNAYALAQYFARIEEVEKDIANGATPRDAICAGFSGTLRTAMLRAIGEAPEADKPASRWTYEPASSAKREG